ncbi:MFS transporter [Bacillus pinisoli]|uniref:MFS transporter n=1 Tax=Bacillus pinisoli TaxID=2901866 RepID=UPI001FF67CF5|nr:MFS transporter [Bacillus pinisoli]
MIKPKTKAFWKTTLALIIGSIVVFGNVYVTQPILPVLTEEFQISSLMASMSVSLVIFSLGLSLIVYGPLSDSFGRRGIMYVSMFLASVLTILMAYVTKYEWLLVLRMLQGVCLAGIPSIAMAYIGEEYEKKAIPLAIGLYIGGNTIGGMGGRVISGFLTDQYNWRVTLLVLGCISFLCFILFVLLLKPSEHFVAKKLDWKLALRDYKSHLHNKTLLFAFLIGGLHFLIFVGQFNYLTYFLSDEPYSLSTTLIGLLFLTYLAGTISSSLAGKMADRLPLTTCILLGILIMFVGLLFTLFHHILLIIAGVLLFCFGFFLAHSISASWVSKYASFAKASASGLYLIIYYIGGSIGPFYLDPFWSNISWPGVVIGCSCILVATGFLSFKLKLIETPVVYLQEKKSTS